MKTLITILFLFLALNCYSQDVRLKSIFSNWTNDTIKVLMRGEKEITVEPKSMFVFEFYRWIYEKKDETALIKIGSREYLFSITEVKKDSTMDYSTINRGKK